MFSLHLYMVVLSLENTANIQERKRNQAHVLTLWFQNGNIWIDYCFRYLQWKSGSIFKTRHNNIITVPNQIILKSKSRYVHGWKFEKFLTFPIESNWTFKPTPNSITTHSICRPIWNWMRIVKCKTSKSDIKMKAYRNKWRIHGKPSTSIVVFYFFSDEFSERTNPFSINSVIIKTQKNRNHMELKVYTFSSIRREKKR